MTNEEVHAAVKDALKEVVSQGMDDLLEIGPFNFAAGQWTEAIKWMSDAGAIDAFKSGVEPEQWTRKTIAKLTHQVCAALPPERRTLVAIKDQLKLPI